MGASKIPVYLPDETKVGNAVAVISEGLVTIRIQTDPYVAELIQESLVGLSLVFLDRDAVDAVMNKREETDG